MARISILSQHELPQEEAERRIEEMLTIKVGPEAVQVELDLPAISAIVRPMVENLIRQELQKRLGKDWRLRTDYPLK